MFERKLKILMCCHLPLRPTLGGAKVYIEAAECYRKKGHQVILVGIDELVGTNAPFMDEQWRVEHFPEILRSYLLHHGNNFDVIEYEAIYLPFDLRNKVRAVLVARSVLLDLHLKYIKVPRFKGVRSLLGLLFKHHARRKKQDLKIDQSLRTMNFADFINVPNPSDKNALMRAGIEKEKIIIQPYGVFFDRWEQLYSQKEKRTKGNGKKIAFVGTFDARKGAVEFPQIIKKMIARDPEVIFKFMGVVGMFPDKESIGFYLEKNGCNKKNVEIMEKYSPEALPSLLGDCSFGIFPSYLESFGFGVLEMMSAGLPVVGYDSPGINMLLLPELTSKAGDFQGLVASLIKLMENEEFKNDCQARGLMRAREFIYEDQTNKSLELYQVELHKRQS